jgi:hypothetical protein
MEIIMLCSRFIDRFPVGLTAVEALLPKCLVEHPSFESIFESSSVLSNMFWQAIPQPCGSDRKAIAIVV